MSGNGRNNKNNEGGFGLGTAVLLGAGAAAAGFLARGLVNSFVENQSQSSGSSSRGPPPSSSQNWRFWSPPSSQNSSSDWEKKSDKNLMARKKQRDAFRDQHVPDELKCVVCLDNPREICIVPCSHVCLCEDCAEKIERFCPVCQQPIQNKKVIYI